MAVVFAGTVELRPGETNRHANRKLIRVELMSSSTTKNFETNFDRCAKAVAAREVIGAPILRERFNGEDRGEKAEWASSEAGQASLKQIIEALRVERKAWKKLLKSARKLAKAEAKPQVSVSPPRVAPAPTVTVVPTRASRSRTAQLNSAKPRSPKASAVAARPRTGVGKTRPGSR